MPRLIGVMTGIFGFGGVNDNGTSKEEVSEWDYLTKCLAKVRCRNRRNLPNRKHFKLVPRLCLGMREPRLCLLHSLPGQCLRQE